MAAIPLDPLVSIAFQTVRHLSQLAEALSYEVLECNNPDAVRRVVVHCTDRAEHVAQEFLPDGSGEWFDNTDFIRRSLLDDVNWMLSAIEHPPAREVLDRTSFGHPKREQLQALVDALTTITPDSGNDWIEHAYPLQQVTVRLQGTRHSDKTDIIDQLETVLQRLKAGDMSGYDHDDDYGYDFKYNEAVPGPSFFDEPTEKR